MDLAQIDRILEEHGFRHSELVGIMQDVQALENYLSVDVLRYIAGRMELNLARMYDIATFYKAFSLVPRGRHVVKVCCGTACHLGGASQNLEQVKRTLNIGEGETTEDRMFSVETVNRRSFLVPKQNTSSPFDHMPTNPSIVSGNANVNHSLPNLSN